MRPARRHFCALLALGMLGGCATPPAPKSTGLTGKWSPVTAFLGGKPFPLVTLQGPLRVTNDRFEFGRDKGLYRVLATSRPAQLDIRGIEGPNAGREVAAIYELKGDELVVCYQLGAGGRPTDFTSPSGSKILLMHYKRIE
jgi:uncharacterized protein (TIGR03067 family)